MYDGFAAFRASEPTHRFLDDGPAGQDESKMTTVKFDHVHLKSPDPEKAAQYYEHMFGAEILRLFYSDGEPRIGVKMGGILLYISDTRGKPAGQASADRPYYGMEHIGFLVDDVDATAAELRRKGAVFSQEPHSPKPGVRNIYILGPDNVHIELINRNS
jgi:catechol 2,3-dioxygenase-like lactoylglutathione lyase family enzyme